MAGDGCALSLPPDRLPYGLLSAEVATEEPIKLVLCDLLQHLCDCQVSSC